MLEKFLKVAKEAQSAAKEAKPETPKTNAEAKKEAGKETAAAKKQGTELAKSATESAEKAAKVTQVVIGGTVVEKKVGPDGKPVFTKKGTAEAIGDISSFVESQIRSEEIQKQIAAHLKPFADLIAQFDDKKRDEAVKKINVAGAVGLDIKKDEDPVKKAADLASAIIEKSDAGVIAVSQARLDGIKRKQNLDYNHILPPNVKTIVVERAGVKIICSRETDSPGKGGRTSYVNVLTGERVYLSGGDKVRIVGTVSTEGTEYQNAVAKEKQYTEIRLSAGRTWEKGSETPVAIDKDKKTKSVPSTDASVGGGMSGGGVSGDTGVGRGASVSAAPSASVSAQPATAPTLQVGPSLSQTPEEMQQNSIQETFNLPGNHMFASMLSPNPQKYPKLKDSEPKLMVYFAGRGHYDAIAKWYKENGPSKQPPAEVLAKAAREDFVNKIFPMLKESWEKGENVHCVLVSHMREYLHPSDSGAAKYWYNELWKQDSAGAVLGSIVSKYKEKSGAKDVKNINLVGHSMGGKALAGLAQLKAKGALPYEFSYFSSDATYWTLELGQIKQNPKTSLYVSYRPGTNTETQAKAVIDGLGLRGEKIGNETVYTSPKYPNVKVVATNLGHSDHTGRYLKPAWELAQRAQTGNLKQSA